MELSLNIAMRENPTRQKFWRVLRVVGIVLFAWSVVAATQRAFTRSSSLIAPENVVAIRLFRGDMVVNDLKDFARGLNVVPEIPLSLADALERTNRTLNIWFDADGTVTMIFDREFTDADVTALASFGATVVRENGMTRISNGSDASPITQSIVRNIFSTLFSGYPAEIVTNEGRINVGVRAESITLHGVALLAAPNIDEAPNANTVVSADFRGTDLATLIPKTFTQNTPGISALFSLAAHNGVSARIDREGDVTGYTFALPLTTDTQGLANEDTLKSIAKELVEVPTIGGVTTFLHDGSRVITLRSREEASVLVRDESPYRFVTATSSYGSLYITQTPTLLTVSNHIQHTNAAQKRSASCLPGTIAFTRPTALSRDLWTSTFYQSSHLSTLLWRADEIASTLSSTRICNRE